MCIRDRLEDEQDRQRDEEVCRGTEGPAAQGQMVRHCGVEEAVELRLAEGAAFSVRLVDCVGYMVDSAVGQFEDLSPRMVMTQIGRAHV